MARRKINHSDDFVNSPEAWPDATMTEEEEAFRKAVDACWSSDYMADCNVYPGDRLERNELMSISRRIIIEYYTGNGNDFEIRENSLTNALVVFRRRIIEGETYDAIGSDIGLCYERVRQIERRVICVLRKTLPRYLADGSYKDAVCADSLKSEIRRLSSENCKLLERCSLLEERHSAVKRAESKTRRERSGTESSLRSKIYALEDEVKELKDALFSIRNMRSSYLARIRRLESQLTPEGVVALDQKIAKMERLMGWKGDGN